VAESTLKLTHEPSPDGPHLIVCEGVLDAHTSGQLESVIDGIIKGGDHKIACDLTGVTYIASAGVGVFVGFVNACQDGGGNLILVHPYGFEGENEARGLSSGYNVLEVFNLLGLADFIPVAKTRDEAFRKLGA
jgi:anti-sigma B factor antagonist